jgi:arabinofuranosyltransferase
MTLDAPNNAAGREPRSPQTESLLAWALVAWVLIVIIRNAWLSDDSYIAFRVVTNFVNGRGMTWNPGQRVQCFTHPAWFFVVSAAHALTHEMYYTAIALSVLVAGSGLWVAARYLARDSWNAWPALLALSFSRAFVDFSTSGLENTLSHLLLFALLVGLVRATSAHGVRALWVDWLFGLVAWNRIDLTLMIAPAWLWLMWRRQRVGVPVRSLLWHSAAAALPILLWCGFSIFYFGFALPNTAYAKLGIGLQLADRASQGFFYLLLLIAGDPASALLLALAVVGAFRGREPWQRPMLLGVVLYVIYVISIGGDFMAGRFFSAPVVVATATVLRMRVERSTSMALAALLVLAGWAGPTPPPLSGFEAEGHAGVKVVKRRYRIMDERRYYHSELGLLTADRLRPMPGGVYRRAERFAGQRGVMTPKIGMSGFLAGPEATLIDPYALTDPFLARLPFPAGEIKPDWTIGHFKRPKPAGYNESVQNGDNRLEDPKLAKFYDQMMLITTGPLWSSARLRAIWRLNTGRLNKLIAPTVKVALPSDGEDDHAEEP